MAPLIHALDVAVQVSFVLLAAATFVDWLRHRDRQRNFLILALLMLTALTLLGPLEAWANLPLQLDTGVAIVVFLLSGYFLLLFRDSLVPLGRRPKAAISIVVALVAIIVFVAGVPQSANSSRTPLQNFALAALLLTWVLCVAEPIFRFGISSIGRPAVEGARLRALSLGYVGLVAVVVVATVLGSAARSANVRVVSDIVVLVVVPMLYASFSPPAWLRRIWAFREQDEIRGALHDLLLFSPDREALARKALEWGARLVGGAAGYIVDADGSILATQGISADAALRLSRSDGAASTLSMPLDLGSGKGSLTILSGPFTPVFGEYEIGLLRGYAVSITAGLDRVALTERITALEKAKGEFLNLASHELRAPMTIIKGYLTMMASGTLGEAPPTFAKVLPMLVAKSDEITSMLEQMIEASRLEDGRLAIKKQRSDVTQLTQDAVNEMEPLVADDRTIEYKRPPSPVWSNVDPDRYHIVVRNLLSNAIKYSPAGSDVEVRLLPNGRSFCLSVTDQGVGIAPEDRGRLFQRFGRIETKETAHTAGTGLGLWLSKEIARMHDGDLTVDSEVGRGSTFTLEIPFDSDS